MTNQLTAIRCVVVGFFLLLWACARPPSTAFLRSESLAGPWQPVAPLLQPSTRGKPEDPFIYTCEPKPPLSFLLFSLSPPFSSPSLSRGLCLPLSRSLPLPLPPALSISPFSFVGSAFHGGSMVRVSSRSPRIHPAPRHARGLKSMRRHALPAAARGWHVIWHVYNTVEHPPHGHECVDTTTSAHTFSTDGITWWESPTQPYASLTAPLLLRNGAKTFDVVFLRLGAATLRAITGA